MYSLMPAYSQVHTWECLLALHAVKLLESIYEFTWATFYKTEEFSSQVARVYTPVDTCPLLKCLNVCTTKIRVTPCVLFFPQTVLAGISKLTKMSGIWLSVSINVLYSLHTVPYMCKFTLLWPFSVDPIFSHHDWKSMYNARTLLVKLFFSHSLQQVSQTRVILGSL